ncbi:YqaA family protein [Insolitispirillum peregrinum]|uniref:Membrane protein YqaA, SNARE-associated domain n=1 Tax=Insolitispirillum peregrinum TaxID=80876 RepID=A0A1N7L694_9PROT|nr:YqaA family protein [Insolitispirillum peregrinum]SIS69385.1 membrane protein YqaA, SNARE-associated domain [Insolitispirillum peregrinum]
MLRKTYDWMMEKAAHRHAIWWLAFISFIESSFFPIPPDVMLIPLILAAPTRWFRIAMICTLSSVIGGFLGYAIGYYLMDSVGMAILGMLHLESKFEALRPLVDEYGVWVIIVKGATPIPYKLITITAGAFHFDLLKFSFASVIARGMRFMLIAVLLWKFGPPIRVFVETRLKLVMTGLVVLGIAGVAVLKFL